MVVMFHKHFSCMTVVVVGGDVCTWSAGELPFDFPAWRMQGAAVSKTRLRLFTPRDDEYADSVRLHRMQARLAERRARQIEHNKPSMPRAWPFGMNMLIGTNQYARATRGNTHVGNLPDITIQG